MGEQRKEHERKHCLGLSCRFLWLMGVEDIGLHWGPDRISARRGSQRKFYCSNKAARARLLPAHRVLNKSQHKRTKKTSSFPNTLCPVMRGA